MTPSPVPVMHRWQILCERHGRIDEQASEVLGRIEPVAKDVRRLIDRGDAEAGLMMVRYFDDPDGGDGHGAMGWWLSAQQISLLAQMGANIEADEYEADFTTHGPWSPERENP
jgi:hypothetical protein